MKWLYWNQRIEQRIRRLRLGPKYVGIGHIIDFCCCIFWKMCAKQDLLHSMGGGMTFSLLYTVPSWKENLMEPLGEEEASDIPEVGTCLALFEALGWWKSRLDPWSGGLKSDCFLLQNLDDNVFLKRHSKHELDEKRRKR